MYNLKVSKDASYVNSVQSQHDEYTEKKNVYEILSKKLAVQAREENNMKQINNSKKAIYNGIMTIPRDQLESRQKMVKENQRMIAKRDDEQRILEKSRQNISGALSMDYNGIIMDNRQYKRQPMNGYDFNNPARVQGQSIIISSSTFNEQLYNNENRYTNINYAQDVDDLETEYYEELLND